MRQRIVTIGKEFHFDAAHFLKDHPGKCRGLHGHTYKVLVELTGIPDPRTYMLVDFYEFGKKVNELLEIYDHKSLNEIFVVTTVERLSDLLAKQIKHMYPKFCVTVQVQEGVGGYAKCSR